MINILLCDDDIYTAKVLKKVIEENPRVKEIYLAKNGEEALEIIKKHDVNLAFMDIDMPEMDGIEASKIMMELNDSLKIVFVTAYKDYAFDSYEIKAYDYILKPIDYSRVKENIEKIIDESHQDIFEDSLKDNNILMIKEKQSFVMVNMEEINYMEKEAKNLHIYTSDKKYVTRSSFADIEERLNQSFFRTHRSYIVNIKNIEKIEPYGDSSYIIYFKSTDLRKNALITKDKIHLLRG